MSLRLELEFNNNRYPIYSSMKCCTFCARKMDMTSGSQSWLRKSVNCAEHVPFFNSAAPTPPPRRKALLPRNRFPI